MLSKARAQNTPALTLILYFFPSLSSHIHPVVVRLSYAPSLYIPNVLQICLSLPSFLPVTHVVEMKSAVRRTELSLVHQIRPVSR